MPAFGVVPACQGYTGWTGQTNPQTDATGMANTNYPEASSTTYFVSRLQGSIGSKATIHGRYPFARFMALEIYTGDMLVDFVDDVDIQPDPGQNNPFVSGTDNGTFTAYLIFGQKPATRAPNTIYTGTLTSVTLLYRLYHATDPNDPAAGATNPVTPTILLNGRRLTNCPVQPILPPGSTPWGRLDEGNWMGTLPAPAQQFSVTDPPVWVLVNPATGHFFPNGANYYMGPQLSRQFLTPNTAHNMFVFRFLAPTYPNTRSGEPVYANRQVRFWSVCTDDPYTTNVNRCIPDDAMLLDPGGYATIVISDPGSKPSDAALSQFSANWLAWGALALPTDVVYDRARKPWGINTPVHYYNNVIYRQTLANPTFTQSFVNISTLPLDQQQAAMGPYWPVSGYCATADFETYGAGCVTH